MHIPVDRTRVLTGRFLMKNRSRRELSHGALVLMACVLWVFPAALRAQAGASLPILGKWTLNAAKSSFGDGPVLRAMTIEYTAATMESVEFNATVTYDNGGQGVYSFKGAADGKDHALTGSSSTYAYSVENGVVTETQKDSDGTLTVGTFARSANGKEGTWTYTITNPDKTVVSQKLVFTKTA